MSLVRSIVFIDGENLNFRFEEMQKEGREALPGVVHIPGVFVWSPRISRLWNLDIQRIIYYTSAVGDSNKIFELKNRISEIQVDDYLESGVNLYGSSQLVPKVFKKERKAKKTRLVDINICIDAMRYAYSNSVESLSFISGDGDFITLYEDLIRAGKKVSLAALSSGLNPNLKFSVDNFKLLDEYFFKPEEQKTEPGESGNG